MKHLLVLPMAFYVFYIFLLLIINFRIRVTALKNKSLPIQFFNSYTIEAPEKVLIAGRHFDNQFQLPVLYLITCATFLILGQMNMATVVLAWGFVVTRILHSIIHLGSNNIMRRMRAYSAGWVIVLLLWMQIVYFALQTT